VTTRERVEEKTLLTAAMIVCAIVLALLLGGCNSDGHAKAQLGKVSAAAAPEVVAREDVSVVPVETESRPTTIQLTGSLAADEQSDVASKRGGIVRAIKVERGDIVHAGDVLMELDRTDSENRLNEATAESAELAVRLGLKSANEKFDPANQPDVQSARAMLDWAAANYKRDTELAASKVLAKSDFDKTKNEYDTAREKHRLAVQQASQLYQTYKTSLARLNTAAQATSDTIVRAPFDGLIAEKYLAAGESVRDGDKVVSLVRISPLRLNLTVPEQQVGAIQKGQAVQFEVASYPGRKFTGTVKYVAPGLENNTRTLIAEAIVPNEDQALLPGLFASARIEAGDARTAMLVPRQAIKREGDAASVFIVDQGVARQKVVTLGVTEQDRVEIVNGLQGKESVVVDASKVRDGVRIR
jgi:RND family efflux transporter MFP subunit